MTWTYGMATMEQVVARNLNGIYRVGNINLVFNNVLSIINNGKSVYLKLEFFRSQLSKFN